METINVFFLIYTLIDPHLLKKLKINYLVEYYKWQPIGAASHFTTYPYPVLKKRKTI